MPSPSHVPTAPHPAIGADLGLDVQLHAARTRLPADTAAILLFDESAQFLVATAASGIEEEVREGSRVRAGVGFAGSVASGRRPVVLDEVTPRNVVNPLLLRRGIASMLGVPIFREARPELDVLGVLHAGSLTPRRFTDDDVAVLQEVAAEVSGVLGRHRAFVDRAAAAALQSSLASRLPDIDGLDLAARYVAGSQYGVGGDWYDVFPLPGGLVGITMGDVMGHGLHAATVMGRARSALRAYALEHADPADVLTRLDRKLRHFEPGMICTVVHSVLDPATGELRVSASGHVPPVLVRAGGPSTLAQLCVDPPVGVTVDGPRHTTRLLLPPGALLCLYTDGLVERRTADLDTQFARLCRTLDATAGRDADAVCADVMSGMLHNRTPEDDVSLLVVRRAGRDAPRGHGYVAGQSDRAD